MAIDFPTSPTPNQLHTAGSRSWTWNNSVGAWYAVNAGVQGIQGIQGTQGTQGLQGITGSQGTQGTQGIQGTQGVQGIQGITGLAFTIAKTYLSVAALNADTAPTAIVAGQFALINTTNVEDAENSRLYIWTGSTYTFVDDLSGSAGIQGITGSQGVQGIQGIQGITGIQGAIGSQGAQGTQGLQGIQGISGASILGTANTWTNTNAFTSVTASLQSQFSGSATSAIFTGSDPDQGFQMISTATGGRSYFVKVAGSASGNIPGAGLYFYDNTATGIVMAFDTAKKVNIYNSLAVTGKLDILDTGSLNQLKVYSSNATAAVRTYSTSDGYGLLLNSYYSADGVGSYNRYSDIVASTGDVSSSAIRFFTKPASGNPLERLRIESTGNVGIGTTSPASKLDVVSGSTGQVLTLRGAGTAFGIASGVVAGANALELTTADVGGLQATRLLFRGGIDAADIEFYRGARTLETISMFIEGDNGNVGIGTASPGAKLEVNNGNILLTGGSDAGLIFTPTSGAYTSSIYVRNEATAGAEAFRIFTRGANPYADTLRIGITSAEATADVYFMNSNVGIGTSSPSGKLEVSGGNISLYNADVGYPIGVGPGIIFSHYGPITSAQTGSGIFSFRDESNSNKHGLVFKIHNTDTTADAAVIAAVIKSNGNVGIGTTSPSATLHIKDPTYNQFTLRVQSGAANNANGYGGIGFSGEDANTKGAIFFQSLASNSYSRGNMIFALNNATDQTSATPSNAVMTLTNDGKVFMCGSTASVSVERALMQFDGTAQYGFGIKCTAVTGGRFMSFYNSGATDNGYIYSSNSTTIVYGSASDGRLKTNIRPLNDSGSIIDAIQPHIFDWKHGETLNCHGFIAQELNEVFPEAVVAGDDDEDVIKSTWGIDPAKLVPVLVAELQSLRARLASEEAKNIAFEARLAALESK